MEVSRARLRNVVETIFDLGVETFSVSLHVTEVTCRRPNCMY